MAVIRLLFGLCLLRFTSAEYVQTLVGDKLLLVAQNRCLKAKQGLLVHLPPQGASRDVARLVDGHWSPKSGYSTRFAPGGAVELKKAAVNDVGLYELQCNTFSKVIIIQVEVLIPHEVWASVGQSQRLQCHFRTIGVAVESVRWDRGTALVVQQQFNLKEATFGESFKDRVELSTDVQSRGDLSISFHSIQQKDQGEFYCRILVSGRDWVSGEPAVTLLWVNKKNNLTTVSLSVGLITVFILLCISLFYIRHLKKKLSKGSSDIKPPESEETAKKEDTTLHYKTLQTPSQDHVHELLSENHETQLTIV